MEIKLGLWKIEEFLSKFPLNNIHGGIKFTMDAKTIYVPTKRWLDTKLFT